MGKGEQTRQFIIEKSAIAFNKHGYGNTSMSDLMKATGLEKGGLYRHFASKEELACVAFDYACQEAFRVKFAGLTGCGLEKLKGFIKAFVTERSPIRGGCPIFNNAVENDDGHPELRRRAQAAYQNWIKEISGFIEDAIDAQEIRSTTVPEELAAFILCSLEGALIAQNLTRSKELLGQTATQLLRHLEALECRN